MRILDIGGGFAGGSFDAAGTVQLGQVPLAVNTALATFFPDPSVKVRMLPVCAIIFCMVFFISISVVLTADVCLCASRSELAGDASTCCHSRTHTIHMILFLHASC